MTVTPDHTLLKRIRQDDESALEALFERYYYRLCDFSFQYVKSFDLTEEIVSDVFLSIWERRHTITIRRDLKAYLFVATRNRSLNHVQREQLDWEPIDEQDHYSGTLRPDEEIMLKEVQQQVDLLLNLLPPRRRLIFKLSRLEGFTYQQIADILSISIHTVQNQMVHAVKQMASLASRIDRES